MKLKIYNVQITIKQKKKKHFNNKWPVPLSVCRLKNVKCFFKKIQCTCL